VPDAFGIRIKTPNGSIFYTGDFRFDYTPLGNMTDFKKLKQMGNENMTILLSDSTNAFSQDHSPTEKDILKDLEKFTIEAKGKVIITTFASQLTRIQSLIEMASKNGRKVVILGRSMVKNIDSAKKIGYIKVENSTFIDKKEISKYPDNKLFILTTGSQGEERAGLVRMSNGKHAQIRLKKNDVVIFSSSPIPGNRIKIELLVNQLCKKGVDIKEHRIDGMLHVSGHAYKEEHIKIFNLTKPKYFLPFHGSYRMSAVHGVTAMQCGVKKENIFIPENGRVMYLDKEKLIITNEMIDVGPVYIDSNTISLTNGPIIKKRAELGENGFVNIVVVIDKKKKIIVGRTRIISRGAVFTKTSKEFLNEIQKMAHGTILHTIKNVEN
jgi:ribonuclease J